MVISLIAFPVIHAQKDYLFSEKTMPVVHHRLQLSLGMGNSFDENELLQRNSIGQSRNLGTARSFELLLGIRIWNNFYAESGVVSRPLRTGFSISLNDSLNTSRSYSGLTINSMVLPVRCKYFFPLEESPVSLFVFGGVKLVLIDQKEQTDDTRINLFKGEETANEPPQTTLVVEKSLGMVLNLGLSATLDLTPNLAVLAGAEYDCGLEPMVRLYVRQQKEDGAVTNSIFNYASGYRFSVGLQYRL